MAHSVVITNVGRAEFCGLAGNVDSRTAFTYIAYGDSSTNPQATQTDLQGTESQRAAATVSLVKRTVSNDTLRLTKTFTISSSETVAECGIFNGATNGGSPDVCGARAVLSPTRSLLANDTWTPIIDVKFG